MVFFLKIYVKILAIFSKKIVKLVEFTLERKFQKFPKKICQKLTNFVRT
jgi:hypothetical protein